MQRALVDDPDLADRTEKVVLFGTPSAGLRKASWLFFWKRQLRNMADGREFITALRKDWATRFEPEPPFDLKVVAGEQDQLVPPNSSLGPFPRRFHFVVPGNHLSMVRAADTGSPSVRLLTSALSHTPAADETIAPLSLSAEIPDVTAPVLRDAGGDEMSVQDIVRAALALEQTGRRDEAMALLQRHQALGSEVQGTLAGRIKRMWLENEDLGFAEYALDLYKGALGEALKIGEVNQIYYHSINAAFLEFVAFDHIERAQEMAELALENSFLAEESAWSVATKAEAYLYLGQPELALDLYRRIFAFATEPWEYASTAFQAGQIASKLNDRLLADRLEEIFTPTVRQTNRIFVSYSHQDTDWMNRLRQMLSQFLRDGDTELQLWPDALDIQPSDRLHENIQSALQAAGVAVVLVSDSFLESEYAMKQELPVILRAAADGKMQLFWIYISGAAYTPPELGRFHAAQYVSRPLSALEGPEQDAVLLKVARDIKAAALGATDRFRNQDQ